MCLTKFTMCFIVQLMFQFQAVSETLKNETVLVMDNKDCDDWLKSNTTNKKILRSTLTLHLKNGPSDGVTCTRGIYKEQENYFTVSIKAIFVFGP